jgi:hypothetical protein
MPLSVFFIAFGQREKPPWGAEPEFELGPPVQQASALPTELCCTLTELSCTLTELCCTLTELRCTLDSYWSLLFLWSMQAAGWQDELPNRALLLLVSFLWSLQYGGWQEELLIGWRKQSSTPIGLFSVIPAGWQEELLIGWRKQRLIPIGSLPATPVGFGLAGRAPPI